MGKITKEQLSIIETYSCERLSSNSENKALIDGFHSEKGNQLVGYLQKHAWDEDLERSVAYYLVKSPGNDVALFFSLKCGTLFDPLDEEAIKRMAQRKEIIKKCLQGLNKEGEEHELALQLLEQFRSGQSISTERIRMELELSQKAQKVLNLINSDKQREGNSQIIRVGKTYPGIEIVHFCVNDSAKDKWKKYGFRHPLGEVMFWYYIAPIIYQTQNSIGCQYAYLFAADMSEDGTLVNYYNVSLKFGQPTEIGTNKPRYDFCCEFMCQELNQLKQNRQYFFDHFNLDADDIIA